MKYDNIVSASFISRPNRFIARVAIDDEENIVHVKNTGRCRELLLPGRKVYLTRSDNPARKTQYDLIAVEKPSGSTVQIVNIDSQAPNKAAEEWLRGGGLFSVGADVRREVTFGGSRFDFCINSGGRISYLEVKGVTLESEGTALFPDAPTERGVRHINELIECARQGYGAYILFVIQMKGIHTLRPNDATHRAFGDALRLAWQSGVTVLAADCIVTADSMVIDSPVAVDLASPIQ